MENINQIKDGITENNSSKFNNRFRNMNIKEKILKFKNAITIEPLICVLVAAKVMCAPALTNLHFEKACKVNAGFNDTVCEAIVSGTYLQMNFKEENNVVQSYLTGMRSWEVPVSSVVPVIIILFVGAYSDRHKIRKPFLLMPLLGDMVGLVGTVVNIIYMKQWNLEMQVIAGQVIPSIFGSDKLIITMCFAYIADISTNEMRLLRMSVIPILLSVLIPVFHAISGIMFRALGYFPIIGISLTLFVFTFVYGIVSVKEPVKIKHDKRLLIKDIANVQHVTDTFKFLVQKKENASRTNFITLLFICFILTTVQSGETSAFFLFTQQAYQWTVVDFSYFNTVGAVTKFIGLTVAVPIFAKVIKLNEIMIIIVAHIDAILVSIIFVVVQSPLGLYVGRACSVLVSAAHPANRSLLTKAVSPDDMAKASSLTTIVGAIAAAISAQIYHQGIYEHTRRTFPQAFLLLGIGLHMIVITILIWMYMREKRKHELSDKPRQEFVTDNVIENSEM
ncbi:hypothetical protein FQR65_LT00653 [Abscondita terminalis]|nr:hypothetical protein FQR65_LT00653 [Abscondita terminalis]